MPNPYPEPLIAAAKEPLVPSAGDEFCSEGYAMFTDYVSDQRGEPTVELWRFASEDDYVEGYGWLHVRVHEIIETERSGTLAVYHRQWFAPDGEPAWGNRKKRVIGSVASLKALIRRRKMSAQTIEARRAETLEADPSPDESAVRQDAHHQPNAGPHHFSI